MNTYILVQLFPEDEERPIANRVLPRDAVLAISAKSRVVAEAKAAELGYPCKWGDRHQLRTLGSLSKGKQWAGLANRLTLHVAASVTTPSSSAKWKKRVGYQKRPDRQGYQAGYRARQRGRTELPDNLPDNDWGNGYRRGFNSSRKETK
jgi:hypothetical protein